ncbi:MAG TPA: hypothetical protein VFY04_10260 [Solirubrobacterales bacterium]|nr:hypothetical protein [Solirubrobacterales bacterium]
MNEQRLRDLLRETPVPGAEDAERHGRAMLESAFADRQPDRRRPAPRRLALALAGATLLLAVILSPAGAAVRDWIDDALTVGVRDAEPALTEIPGGGRLLVTSPQGAWAVQADGSRRLLGAYEEATWSPRGLFAVAASGRTLSAIEPDGTVRWSISATASVADPRWSPSGFRIAYRAGRTLRVVGGDGSGDRPLARGIAAVAAAWVPGGPHVLAYADADGEVVVRNADTGEILGSTEASAAARAVTWAPDGSSLLVATRDALLVHDVGTSKLVGRLALGAPRRLPLPPASTVAGASFSPGGETIAALLSRPGDGARPARSELVLIDPAGGGTRGLFRAPGPLAGFAWSPNSERLLLPWPAADQWLFIPADGRGRVRAIGGISAEFSPGMEPDMAVFPRLEGWCCP